MNLDVCSELLCDVGVSMASSYWNYVYGIRAARLTYGWFENPILPEIHIGSSAHPAFLTHLLALRFYKITNLIGASHSIFNDPLGELFEHIVVYNWYSPHTVYTVHSPFLIPLLPFLCANTYAFRLISFLIRL